MQPWFDLLSTYLTGQTSTSGSCSFAYSGTRINKQINRASLDFFPQKPSFRTASAKKPIPFHTNRHFD